MWFFRLKNIVFVVNSDENRDLQKKIMEVNVQHLLKYLGVQNDI